MLKDTIIEFMKSLFKRSKSKPIHEVAIVKMTNSELITYIASVDKENYSFVHSKELVMMQVKDPNSHAMVKVGFNIIPWILSCPINRSIVNKKDIVSIVYMERIDQTKQQSELINHYKKLVESETLANIMIDEIDNFMSVASDELSKQREQLEKLYGHS